MSEVSSWKSVCVWGGAERKSDAGLEVRNVEFLTKEGQVISLVIMVSSVQHGCDRHSGSAGWLECGVQKTALFFLSFLC